MHWHGHQLVPYLSPSLAIAQSKMTIVPSGAEQEVVAGEILVAQRRAGSRPGGVPTERQAGSGPDPH